MHPYTYGSYSAMAYFGMEKTALSASTLKAIGKKFPVLRNFLASDKVPAIKRFFIGEPDRVLREFQQGGLPRLFQAENKSLRRAPGAFRDSMSAPGLLSKVLFYGLPAAEVGGIMLDKEPDKASRAMAAGAGALVGAATWKPLGLIGSSLLYPVGRAVGGGAGALVDTAIDTLKGQ